MAGEPTYQNTVSTYVLRHRGLDPVEQVVYFPTFDDSTRFEVLPHHLHHLLRVSLMRSNVPHLVDTLHLQPALLGRELLLRAAGTLDCLHVVDHVLHGYPHGAAIRLANDVREFHPLFRSDELERDRSLNRLPRVTVHRTAFAVPYELGHDIPHGNEPVTLRVIFCRMPNMENPSELVLTTARELMIPSPRMDISIVRPEGVEFPEPSVPTEPFRGAVSSPGVSGLFSSFLALSPNLVVEFSIGSLRSGSTVCKLMQDRVIPVVHRDDGGLTVTGRAYSNEETMS